ncbi:hypothetical protein Q8W71_32605 [Methylobacterium sp. NEAU 140]|uniref:DUF6894 family protein n=1 Tax=Methylobacterium sp. NEAU 140 TaxID=3064945 RepID=UPI0027365DD7|nr:hypothetical protein [Methylobacterium sp. NEAU 140]MDP4027305.1 hypothetical protein [Methylobacterium sp. NEAU 140]
MPRYFISTSDGFQAHDPEGIELPDTEALARMLRRTLAAILADEGTEGGRNEFWADALDERGERVMTARVSLSVAVP